MLMPEGSSTTYPTWHYKFFDEMVDLSNNMFRSISWQTSGGHFTIRIEFHYNLWVALMFYDEQAMASLMVYDHIWHYEYSDPKFTPKTLFDNIKERTERWKQ